MRKNIKKEDVESAIGLIIIFLSVSIIILLL